MPLFERPTNITDFDDFFFSYPNDTLFQGLWGIGIIVAFYLIVFISLVQAGAQGRRAFAAATFLTWLLSIMLVIFGALSSTVAIILSLMVVIAIIVVRDR